MSQIDLKELTKKNQEFIHIATQQFLKDGKTDAEIKAILEEVIPHILEEQPKGVTARSIYGEPNAFWLIVFIAFALSVSLTLYLIHKKWF